MGDFPRGYLERSESLFVAGVFIDLLVKIADDEWGGISGRRQPRHAMCSMGIESLVCLFFPNRYDESSRG